MGAPGEDSGRRLKSALPSVDLPSNMHLILQVQQASAKRIGDNLK